MASKVVLIAGNVCSGKSTIIDYIEERKEEIEQEIEQLIVTFTEYLDPIWRKNFYKDRKKHTRDFEFDCLSGRKARHQEAKDFRGVAFFDRGMIEGAETFARNSYFEGFFRKRQYDEYIGQLYDNLDDLDRTEAKRWLESLVVYLEVEDSRVLSERSEQRVKERGTERIPTEYLDVMNRRYQTLFGAIEHRSLRYRIQKIYKDKYAVPPPEVIKIDASVNMIENDCYLSETVARILRKLKGDEIGRRD